MYEQMKRAAVGATDRERALDELTRRIQSMIELKTGFAEAHQMSRELQRLFKQHDVDGTGTMSPAEFTRVVNKLQIGGTAEENEALFDRFDLNENGLLSFQEFSDGVFGVRPSPLSDPQCRTVLERFKAKILKRAGPSGMRGFSRSLRIMDKDRSNCLSKEELMNGMQRLGCRCTPEEMQVVMNHFDRDGNGTVSVTEFLRAVRGKLNARRRDMVHQAYGRLDKNADGTVTLADISQAYDATQHPDVLKGERSEEDVLKEFMSSWDKDGDGTVTIPEWEDYYKDISVSIDNDDYFELMIRNTWRISGGEGWCANTACRRVLVTHKDGSQSVREIKDDLGIGPNDIDKMKVNLMRQGITDIKRIELHY